jgi:hypothetical protein
MEVEIIENGEYSLPGDSYEMLYENTGRDE